MSEPNLSLHAENLLIKLVDGWDAAPPERQFSFGVSPGANRFLTLFHEGLPDGKLATLWSHINELTPAGMILDAGEQPLYAEYRMYFSLTTKGRNYVRNLRSGAVATGPRLFIVHGHDDVTKWEVKNFLQNRLHLPEPVVLHEQPNRGRTIIEKFEEHASEVDGAVVLLTPDDRWGADGSNDELRRARQNVIFELGYFFGHFQRRTGRVLLLYRGVLDLPSDIAGIVYIDISNGVESAGELIRRELLRP